MALHHRDHLMHDEARRGSAGSCLQALGAVGGAQRVPADGVRYFRNHWQHALAHFGPAGSGVPANHVTKHRFDLVRWTSEELRLAADGSGRPAYGNDEPPVLPTSADRRAWLRSGSPAFEPGRATLIAVGASDAPRSAEIRWSTLYAVRSAVVGKVGDRPRR